MKIVCISLLLLFLSSGTFAQADSSEIRVVDKPPVARGCDPNADNPTLKDYFTRVVTEQIVKKIKPSYLRKHGLAPGLYTVYTTFSIDQKGRVQDVTAEFEVKKIAKHIATAVRSIAPVKPGYIDEEPVRIFYAIPIKFRIE